MGSVGGYKELGHVALASGEKRNNGAFSTKDGKNQKKSVDKEEKPKKHPQSSNISKHRSTEKQRRRKMSNMFQELHALLPKPHPKTNFSTVVEETISYIKSLEHTLQKHESQKLERLHRQSTNTSGASMIHPEKQNVETLLDIASCLKSGLFSFPWRPPVFQTWTSSNVTLNVCGQDALISICSSKKPGFLTVICFVLDKYKIDTISAQVYSDESKHLVTIHAHVNAPGDLLATFPYEEVYKKAAQEITLRVKFGSM